MPIMFTHSLDICQSLLSKSKHIIECESSPNRHFEILRRTSKARAITTARHWRADCDTVLEISMHNQYITI